MKTKILAGFQMCICVPLMKNPITGKKKRGVVETKFLHMNNK